MKPTKFSAYHLKYSYALLLILFSCSVVEAQPEISIIPEPVRVTPGKGAFTLTAGSDISVPNNAPEVSRIATYFAQRVKTAAGFDLKVVSSSRGVIQLELLVRQDPKLGTEGYTLDVTET